MQERVLDAADRGFAQGRIKGDGSQVTAKAGPRGDNGRTDCLLRIPGWGTVALWYSGFSLGFIEIGSWLSHRRIFYWGRNL
jgi:hypothetical protein